MQQQNGFKLRFAPAFTSQRKSLLSLKNIPEIEIPEQVERCLSGISVEELATDGRQFGKGEFQLWSGVIRAIRPLLLRAAGFSLFASAGAAASSLAAMQILKAHQTLKAMLVFSLLFYLANTLAQFGNYWNGRLRSWVALAAESYLVGLLSGKLLRLSSRAAARQSSGNLKVLVTSDVKNIGDFLNSFVRSFIPSVVALLVITPLLYHFSGRAGLLGVFTMVLIIPVGLGLNRINAHFQAKGQGELDSLTTLVGEWVKNIRLIRYLSWDEAISEEVSSGLRKYISVCVSQHFILCLIFGLGVSWWMISITSVVMVSHWFHLSMDLIAFFGSLWLLSFLGGYFTHLPQVIRLYGQAVPSIRRIARVLSEEEQGHFLQAQKGPMPKGRPVQLNFENVAFSYPEERFTIENLSLNIDLSKKLAIIGEIGSGKSTFLKLLCGDVPPSKGRIWVVFEDGSQHDLWSHGIYSLFRDCLAFVPQEPFVSSDPLRRNISLTREARDEEVMISAYWAELEADIAAFPRGLLEEIGESGVNLSGGQRQRLNLARAHFSNRDYLVLDDTLSAVDTLTETVLMDRLLAREGGFVLVTHRTRELLRVHEVMVLSSGRVVERGDPKVLASQLDSHFTRVLSAYEEEGSHD